MAETVWDRSERYEHAQVGDTLYVFDWWQGCNGRVVWLDDWQESYGSRERLLVLAANEGGLRMGRIYRTPAEPWHTGRDCYNAILDGPFSGIALTEADLPAFLRTVHERAAAEVSLAIAIAECDHEDDYAN